MALGSVGLFLFRPVTMADMNNALHHFGPDWSSQQQDASGLQVFWRGEPMVVVDFGEPDEDEVDDLPPEILDEVRKAAKTGGFGKGPKPVVFLSLVFENRDDQLPWQAAFEIGRAASKAFGTAVIHDFRRLCANMAHS